VAIARLTADAEVIALACSSLGLPPRSDLRPLGPREWNDLALRLHGAAFSSPSDLAGRTTEDLEAELGLDPAMAYRVASLLSRGAAFGIELEALNARGIWVRTRIDPDYPSRLRTRLHSAAPPVIFGCGEIELLERGGIAVVGSRDAAQAALDVAGAVAQAATRAGLAVVSGAARGIDSHAMNAALDAGGASLGVVAEALDRLSTRAGIRQPIEDGQVVLITSRHPSAGFSVGAAMGRNRLIYCLADAAVVAQSALENGGTRNGALEALKAGWVPVWASLDGDMAAGNLDLVARGARALPAGEIDVAALVDTPSGVEPHEPEAQQTLF
jgi:predicted Rossmann fold nucleotide-binding protein DprA/Smf involved in DNA uptake